MIEDAAEWPLSAYAARSTGSTNTVPAWTSTTRANATRQPGQTRDSGVRMGFPLLAGVLTQPPSP